MLEVFCYGGLGNQMFQYAFVLYLEAAGNEVVLNTSDFVIHNHHQGFELSRVFDITERIEKKKPSGINVNSICYRILMKFFNIKIVGNKEYHEKYEISSVPCVKFSQDMVFYGYWQNIKYIIPIEQELRKKFTFEELDGKNLEFYKRISAVNSVAIHVRRGDYVGDILGTVCDKEYYEKAIAYMYTHVTEPVFVFFSDDIEWCKNNFDLGDAYYVDWNKGDKSYLDMQLMSLCKHNIIANSTFSWWGAFLNLNKEKIVVSPKYWHKNSEINNLLLDGWIGI